MKTDSRPAGRAGRTERKGRAALLSLLGLALLSLSTCGLEDYPYLYPASGVSASSSTTLDFSHNVENNGSSYFLGYEVYYRIYDGTSSSASAVATNDMSYIMSSWDDVTPDVILARLKAKGYVRLVRTDRSSLPFVPVDSATMSSGEGVYTSFTLDSSGSAAIIVNSDSSDPRSKTFSVRRNTLNSAGSDYRNFGDFTEGDDCDYTTYDNADPDYAYVEAYVFAYGLDDSLNTVVSRPSLLTNGAVLLTKSGS